MRRRAVVGRERRVCWGESRPYVRNIPISPAVLCSLTIKNPYQTACWRYVVAGAKIHSHCQRGVSSIIRLRHIRQALDEISKT